MTYKTYLEFYGLTDNAENHESWLYNEWHHGRLYMYNGEFYNTYTNKKVN